ncbi:MAG: hypothetical protein IPP13_22340 [Kouleothrix sp.]|nr:hypothetical protein [Kouleothrix sp.]
MNKRTVKVKAKLVKANLIVSEGDGWRVEYDRVTKDYVSYVKGRGYIGSSAKPLEAQQRCQAYAAEALTRAAA